MDNYLLEAFQRLKLMEDDFDLSVDKDKVDELKAFIADDVDEIPEEPIIDVKADDESELQDNYIGKVILECDCCHSRIYKDEEEVFIDDESGLANIDEQCPVCNNSLGFTVIGKIEPFDKDREIKPEEEEDVEELPADDIDVEEEEVEEVEESLQDRIHRKHLQEAKKVCPKCGKEPCVCESCKDESLIESRDDDLGGLPKINAHPEKIDPRDRMYALSGDVYKKGSELTKDEINSLIKAKERSNRPGQDKEIEALKSLLGEGKDCANCDESCSKDEELVEAKEIDASKFDKIRDAFAIDNWKRSSDGNYIIFYNDNGIVVGYIPKAKFGSPFKTLFDYINAQSDSLEFEDKLTRKFGKDIPNPNYRDVEESLDEGKDCADCDESCSKDESLTEAVNNLSLDTDDTHLEMTADENGKVTVTTEPITEEEEFPADDIPLEGEVEETGEGTGEEEIVPLEPEEEAEIEANEPESEEEPVSDEETEVSDLDEYTDEEEPEEEVDIEDFEEEPFDEMGESYMRKVYSNVSGYKTTKINESNGSVIVEGLISFNSGATKPTKFVFDNASFSKRGKLVLEGYNKTFSKSNKSFIVRGSLVENKFTPESMIYNYKVKQLNESTGSNETLRVYGRIKRK